MLRRLTLMSNHDLCHFFYNNTAHIIYCSHRFVNLEERLERAAIRHSNGDFHAFYCLGAQLKSEAFDMISRGIEL